MSHVRAFVSAAARLAPIDLLAAIAIAILAVSFVVGPVVGQDPTAPAPTPAAAIATTAPAVASQDPATAAPPESVAPARTAAPEAASAVPVASAVAIDDHVRLPGPAGIVQVRQQRVG